MGIKYEVKVKDADAAKSVSAVTSDVKAESSIGVPLPDDTPEETSEVPIGAIVGIIFGGLVVFLVMCICCAPGRCADSMRDSIGIGRVCCGDDEMPVSSTSGKDDGMV